MTDGQKAPTASTYDPVQAEFLSLMNKDSYTPTEDRQVIDLILKYLLEVQAENRDFRDFLIDKLEKLEKKD